MKENMESTVKALYRFFFRDTSLYSVRKKKEHFE